MVQQGADLHALSEEAAARLDGLGDRCTAAGARLDGQPDVLAALACRPELPASVREQLLSVAQAVTSARRELQHIHDASRGLRQACVDRLQGIVGQLIDAGQYQDSFAQIIDRVPPALQARHELIDRLLQAGASGAELEEIAGHAAGLAGLYMASEACHRDPHAPLDSPGAEFF